MKINTRAKLKDIPSTGGLSYIKFDKSVLEKIKYCVQLKPFNEMLITKPVIVIKREKTIENVELLNAAEIINAKVATIIKKGILKSKLPISA